MMSQTLSFVVLHDCLEDAAYALEAGQSDQAVAYLETARYRLRELVADLMTARNQITELEELLHHVVTHSPTTSPSEIS
jgi:hypothetical protein